MAGIGKYKKSKKFQLKSGNSTTFKMMGATPYKQIDPANLGTLGLHQATASTTGVGSPIIPTIEKDYTPPTQDQITKFSEKNVKKIKTKSGIDWSKAPAIGTKERTNWYKKHNLKLDDTTPTDKLDTKKVDKIEGSKDTKLEKATGDKLSGRSRKATKLTKALGIRQKGEKTRVIRGVEKEWRGGRWQTKKSPAEMKHSPKKMYKKTTMKKKMPADAKGLSKLPTNVQKKMGYTKDAQGNPLMMKHGSPTKMYGKSSPKKMYGKSPMKKNPKLKDMPDKQRKAVFASGYKG
jgi:hypothetical protein